MWVAASWGRGGPRAGDRLQHRFADAAAGRPVLCAAGDEFRWTRDSSQDVLGAGACGCRRGRGIGRGRSVRSSRGFAGRTAATGAVGAASVGGDSGRRNGKRRENDHQRCDCGLLGSAMCSRQDRWAISITTSACRSPCCGLPDEARVAVLEMGMNHAGEIRDLGRIARPDIGVVTNVRLRAHRELRIDRRHRRRQAGTDRGTAARTGVAVLNDDDASVCRQFNGIRGTRLLSALSQATDVRARTVARTACASAWAACSSKARCPAGTGFEISWRALLCAACSASTSRTARSACGLSRPAKCAGSARRTTEFDIFNDCYNSNPDAARAMLEVLRETPQAAHRGSGGDARTRPLGRASCIAT